MDITFSCPNCNQSLMFDESAAGQIVPCPKCSQNLTIPPASPASTKRSLIQKWASAPFARPALEKPSIIQKWPSAPSGSHRSKPTVQPTKHPLLEQPPPRQLHPLAPSGNSINISEIKCSHCGTANSLVKASALFEQGTASAVGQSTHLGIAVSSHGNLLPLVSAGPYRATQQTILARKLSPPARPSREPIFIKLTLAATVLIVLILMAYAFASDGFYVGILFILPGFIWCVFSCKKRYHEYQTCTLAQHNYGINCQAWQRLWYCTRCGETSHL